MIHLIAIVVSIIECVCFYFIMRYNLHMFQLCGYKNREYLHWLRKNYSRQMLLLVGLVPGILGLVWPGLVLHIILVLFSLVLLWYYLYLRRTNTKKKLVYTMRVRRQMVTDLLIGVIVLVLVACLAGIRYLPAVVLLLGVWQIIALPVVNLINHPVEEGINRHYIHDAQRKLSEVPDLQVIGVTGSYGKTSVKFYLQTLLQEQFNVLVTPESYNTPMGVVKTIRQSLKPSHEIFVCEMGARHVGDIKEICDIVHPRHGVITSIGPQHLETFFTMDNIVHTKFELADALPQDGWLFLNGDNAYITGQGGAYTHPIYYRMQSEGEGYQASDIRLTQLGTEFDVTAPDGETEHFQMQLVGEYNVINVMAAIAVAHTFGIPLARLKVPVRRLRPVEHRMQMIPRGNVTVIDDAYNSNPVGSKAAVETLAMFDGTRILITPGMVELGQEEETYNYKFGTYAAACCDYILLVGKQHTAPIRQGALDSGFAEDKCLVYEKLEDAMAYANGIHAQGHKYILLENDLPDNY